MEVLKTSKINYLKLGRGRPQRYPFESIMPGHYLKVPIPERCNKTEFLKNVSGSLYHFKKKNNPEWVTACRIVGESIHVYRLEGERPPTVSKKESVEKPKLEYPTLEEVVIYFNENGYTEEAGSKAFNYYQSANWHDARGNKVKNWKQKMQAVWFKEENKVGAVTLLFNNQQINNESRLGTSAARIETAKKW